MINQVLKFQNKQQKRKLAEGSSVGRSVVRLVGWSGRWWAILIKTNVSRLLLQEPRTSRERAHAAKVTHTTTLIYAP